MGWSALKQENLGVAGEAKGDFSVVMVQDADKSRKWLDFCGRKWSIKAEESENTGGRPCFFSVPEKKRFLITHHLITITSPKQNRYAG